MFLNWNGVNIIYNIKFGVGFMEKINNYGLAAYWNLYKDDADTTKGDIIELPACSTPIDFAYRLNVDMGNQMIGTMINDTLVGVDY